MASEKDSSSSSQTSPGASGLLKILWSVFCGALIGLFLSKLHTPPNQHSETIRPENSTTNPDVRPESTFDVKIPNTNPDKNNTQGGRDNTPFRKTFYETSVALGTLGLLVINFFLLLANNRQLKDFEDVQRARLVIIEHIVPDGFNVEEPNTLFVTVMIKNAGQTAAEGISVNHGEGSGIEIPYGELSIKPSPDPNGISLAPGDTKTFKLPWFHGPIDLSKQYPSDDVTISYRDIFGKSSALFSCVVYVPRKHLGWVPCHYTYPKQ